MSLVRFSDGDGPPRPGYMPDDRIVALEDVDGDLSVDEFLQSPADVETAAREALVASATDARDVSTAQLHRPVEPEKIVRLEGCYRQDLTDEEFNPRIEKDGLNQMEWPTSWTAPLSSTTGPEGPLAIPRYVSEVRPGLELGLVVGRETRHWDGNDITEVVAGVTIGAPLTIHDELPGLEGYKMFDDAMAVGPGVTPIDAVPLDTAELRLAAAGERLATHQTTEWRFDPIEMITHVSELLTLKAGDIVFTGDPTRVPTFVADGDIVEATIEGVGSVTVPISGDNRGEEAE